MSESAQRGRPGKRAHRFLAQPMAAFEKGGMGHRVDPGHSCRPLRSVRSHWRADRSRT